MKQPVKPQIVVFTLLYGSNKQRYHFNLLLPQAKEFKYLRAIFTTEGKMERKVDRRIGAYFYILYYVVIVIQIIITRK